MSMDIRNLELSDLQSIWDINEEGLPGTGKVSQEEIKSLLDYSSLAVGVYSHDQLLGFVICLPPRTDYGSLNYAWFNQRYEKFLYVDRIAVKSDYQNQNIGSNLYDYVKKWSKGIEVPVTAEVNIHPPNPGSMRFHIRHGFEQVGVLQHGEKSVALFVFQH